MRVLFCVLVFFFCFASAELMEDLFTDDANVAIRWARLHFEIHTSPQFTFTPSMAARSISVVQNAVYDTWSYFDSAAAPTITYPVSKRSGSTEDISIAISVAGWRSLLHVYQDMPMYDEVKEKADDLLEEITGLRNPDSRNRNSPIGLANIIADELMTFCDRDGANNYGSHPFTTPNALDGSMAYQDYTNYAPVNEPLDTTRHTSAETCSRININKWQPLTTPVSLDGSGSQTQVYFSPHMANVKGFALKCTNEIRPQGPPVFGTNPEGRKSFEEQHNEILQISTTLTDRQKIIAEFWGPAPQDYGNPSNHNIFFAINALIEQNRNLEDSVKLLMVLGNSQFDAGIAAWDAKRYYDSSRPITAIRCMHSGEEVISWAGPYQGLQRRDAGSWLPFQPLNFVSPPFGEYVSGHSTFAMAGAVIFEYFFESPAFIGPNRVSILPGESTTEPRITDPNNPLYVAGVTDVPNEGPNTIGYSPRNTVELEWDTWREAAEESGISRLYGGVHIEDGNLDGLELGAKAAEQVWDKATDLFRGRTSQCESYSDSFSSSSSSDAARNLPILFLTIVFVLFWATC